MVSDINKCHGCYLYWKDLLEPNCSLTGVDQKILGQIAAFESYGMAIELLPYRRAEDPFRVSISCLPWTRDGNNWPDADILAQFDFVYVRRPRYLSKELIALMKDTALINPSIKRIIEFPTYPYWSRLGFDPARRLMRLKDAKTLPVLSDGFDAAAAVFAQPPEELNMEVFSGIKILRLYNGVSLSSVRAKAVAGAQSALNICCAALFAKWHGIDRFLRGLYEYYQNQGKRNIVLHLMGDGPEVSHLKRLTKKLGISKHVVFYGFCNRSEMDAIYDLCTVAIESLGLHRVDTELVTAIKVTEYLAKGIPFIYEGQLALPTGKIPKWSLQIPADETPIDIENVIDFHDKLYYSSSQVELIDEIRSFASNNATVELCVEEIANYLINKEV